MELKKQINPRSKVRRRTSDYYVVTDCHTGQILGRLANVSLEGFKIIADEELTEPSYDLKVSFPRCFGNVKELSLQAHLRWCKENARMNWYEAGFEIEKISAPCMEIFQQVINDIMCNESGKLNP